jgi:hypothetical protein
MAGMAKKKRKFHVGSYCMLSCHVIESDAFRELSGGAAYRILIRFYQKIHRHRPKRKPIKDPDKLKMTNDGEITLTYAEAGEFGLSEKTYNRVLHELVEDKGFIDIAECGNWYHRQPTRFAVSDRWKHYGTPQYKRVKMPRGLPRGLGFKRQSKNKTRCHG